MYIRIRALPGVTLALLGLGIAAVAVMAWLRPLVAKATELPVVPAPTLLQSTTVKDPWVVVGLTKNDTVVSVYVNNQAVVKVQQRSGTKGVGSFAAWLPQTLPVGMYEVVAQARSRATNAVGGLSQPLYMVVEGTMRIWRHTS